MTEKVNNNIIVGAHQAPNGKNMHKWTELKILLEGLDRQYPYPKILYVDANTDVSTNIFKRLEQ